MTKTSQCEQPHLYLRNNVPAHHRQLYVDCANPSNTISARDTWSLIRKLIAGFHAAGLQQGDCVCIHAFNFVSQTQPPSMCFVRAH